MKNDGKQTYSFPNEQGYVLAPVSTIHLHEIAEVLVDLEDTDTLYTILDGLNSWRDLFTKAPSTNA